MRRVPIALVLRKIGIEYKRYQIYECSNPPRQVPGYERVQPVTAAGLVNARRELRLVGFDGLEARGFGIKVEGELAAVCWYWYGDRYRTARGFIELPSGGAKLVQVVTAPQFRGQGLATALISGSALAMRAEGFGDLLARVWHTNRASRAAFRKAGWIEREMINVLMVGRFPPVRYTQRPAA
jgi:GNAT superfamily N-acetyltransferase